MTHGARSIVLVAALAAAAGSPVQAQDPVEGEIRFGIQHFLRETRPDAAKFLEYRDVPNGFVAERLLFSWTPTPGFFLSIDAVDVSQRDQRLGVVFGSSDLWRGTIRWAENPRLWTDEARTLFVHQGRGVFTLEDTFQSAVQAAVAANVDADGDDVWDPGTKGRVVQLAVAEGARDVLVGHQRETGGVGFMLTPNRNWTFAFSADRERREGTTPQTLGMTFSLAPAEVAAPYDLRTDWLNGVAEYSSPRCNMGVQATASFFRTGYTSLTWDNQMFLDDTATANPLSANPGRGRMSLWNDNQWTRVGLFGGVNLPGRTRIDASVSRTQTTQDDELLPMTINALLAPSPLPASRFDGEHVTTNAQIRVSSRPVREFRWSAWARMFELDNESPSLTFQDYVTTDASIPVCGNVNVCDASGNGSAADDRIARRSLPFAFERSSLGALVGWSPVSWLDGALSYEREEMKREFSAVEDSGEDIYKLALDFDLGEAWGLRATIRHQERRADAYHSHYLEESFPIGEPVAAAFNEGMRRFYWTDRDRDSAGLLLDWTPVAAWSFYGEATWQDDEYFDPETGQELGTSFTVMQDRNFDGAPEAYDILLAGRTKDTMRSWTAGVAFTPGSRFGVSADHTFERWEYSLASRYRNVAAGVGTDNPLDNWSSDVEDDHRTINVGLQAALTADARWRLSVDVSRSEGRGVITTDFVPGGASSGDTPLTEFPELESVLTIGMAAVTHSLRPGLDYAVRYWYESWNEDNFSADFNRPYMGAPSQDPSMAQALYLGLDFQDYTNHILSLILRVRY
ncbi:MAG TPA: MtrB/PioB family outer membrane beta-barrel protein [Candidatus Polarisedimenticolia bacterium]|nr:MtrB/PioB family outer membrane beta-barrel protein [Candidatus Polarisedimenticolia bacterium]